MTRLWIAVVLSCALGCAASVPTEVMLVLDAEPDVRSMTSEIHLEIRSGSDDVTLDMYETRFAATFESGTTPVRWQRRVALVPLDPDNPGGFWVELIARASDGSELAVARRHSAYDNGRAAMLPITLQDACLGVVCPEDARTCIAGLCEAAFVDPNTLPNLPIIASD